MKTLEIFKNRKEEFKFISLGDNDGKFIVLNENSKILELEQNQISLKTPDPVEFEISNIPDNLKPVLDKYLEELNGFEKFDQREMKILNDYIFNGRSHTLLSEKHFGVAPTGSHDGWTAGNYLRERNVAGSLQNQGEGLVLDYIENRIRYQDLPDKVKLLVRLKRYGRI